MLKKIYAKEFDHFFYTLNYKIQCLSFSIETKLPSTHHYKPHLAPIYPHAFSPEHMHTTQLRQWI